MEIPDRWVSPCRAPSATYIFFFDLVCLYPSLIYLCGRFIFSLTLDYWNLSIPFFPFLLCFFVSLSLTLLMLDCGICYICVCYKRYLIHISHCLCFQLTFFLCIFLFQLYKIPYTYQSLSLFSTNLLLVSLFSAQTIPSIFFLNNERFYLSIS
jgi:hypothetical protein